MTDRPCPFCGSARSVEIVGLPDYHGRSRRQGVCSYCGARGPVVQSEQTVDARSAWNQRIDA